MGSRQRYSGEKQHNIFISWSLNSLLKQFVFMGKEIFEG
jgi:hypothetical protein